MELIHGILQVRGGEIRPAPVREIKLGVGAFPQKEIAQTLLSAGANEKIDIAGLTGPVIDFAHCLGKVFARDCLAPAKQL